MKKFIKIGDSIVDLYRVTHVLLNDDIIEIFLITGDIIEIGSEYGLAEFENLSQELRDLPLMGKKEVE